MFREALERLAGPLSEVELDRLEAHYNLMVRWNRRLNLTRIIEPEEAARRHYAESIALARELPRGALRVADIGSGAGFPGIPIAVVRPECSVCLIESHKRKAVFLREATRDLPNVVVIAERAESVRATFDWVVSRGVKWEGLAEVAARLAPNSTRST
ncbi:MAG: 16S rRNA (guanine(527)-N(7))-methyltransferase RsmG [Bryobacteraceae bacterium]